jgi:hypothetical protein
MPRYASAGNCDSASSEVGADGKCYALCPAGFERIDNGPSCAKVCPPGFVTMPAPESGPKAGQPACLRPSLVREVKPMVWCSEPGATRQYNTCFSECPKGTSAKFELCVPDCPVGFVNTSDGLSCQATFVKRQAVVREACYENETRVDGRVCLAPCPSGLVAVADQPELCYAPVPQNVQNLFWSGDPKSIGVNLGPLVAKLITPRGQSPAGCDLANFEPLFGQCYANCPPNMKPLGAECIMDCPDGFLQAAGSLVCLPPIVKTPVVATVTEKIESVIRTIGYILAGLVVIAVVTSFLKKR